MEVAQTDLLDGDPPDAELMLVGDLFYDPALAARVELFLRRCLAAGIAVLIGDPWRAPLPADRLRVVAEYPVADFGDPNGATRAAAVFELEG
jgi:predicted nicotinamide N-methyase